MDNIAFPDEEVNAYYEWSSADGFAYLGTAKALNALDYTSCLEEVNKRNWRLKSSISINGNKTTENNKYVYTLWTCAEFFDTINDVDSLNKIAAEVYSIGTYPSGKVRYCSEEVYYVVPNVTSAAILVYTLVGNKSLATKLLDILQDWQSKNGNWHYYTLDHNLNQIRIKTKEDCYHVAMIIYHLREANRINPELNVDSVVSRSIDFLMKDKPRCKICRRSKGISWLCDGSIGWGVPMIYLATKGLISREKEDIAKKLTCEYLNHANFRVRTTAAWALAKAEKY